MCFVRWNLYFYLHSLRQERMEHRTKVQSDLFLQLPPMPDPAGTILNERICEFTNRNGEMVYKDNLGKNKHCETTIKVNSHSATGQQSFSWQYKVFCALATICSDANGTVSPIRPRLQQPSGVEMSFIFYRDILGWLGITQPKSRQCILVQLKWLRRLD